MRIRIVDKQIKHVLNLTSEELMLLLRLQPLDSRRVPFKIVSPVLIVCGDQKYEVPIIRVDQLGSTRRGEYPLEIDDVQEMIEEGQYFGDVVNIDEAIPDRPPVRQRPRERKKVDPTSKIPSFMMEVELNAKLFEGLMNVESPLVLMRVQNIPVYTPIEDIRVNFNKPKATPVLLITVERVQPIVDLLKTQLTESAFYETFIVGKSEQFFESAGVKLDDLVALVGIKRKENESDTELRIRVKEYLKIRIAGTTDVNDDELKALIRQTEEVAEIERSMDEASRRGEKEGLKCGCNDGVRGKECLDFHTKDTK